MSLFLDISRGSSPTQDSATYMISGSCAVSTDSAAAVAVLREVSDSATSVAATPSRCSETHALFCLGVTNGILRGDLDLPSPTPGQSRFPFGRQDRDPYELKGSESAETVAEVSFSHDSREAQRIAPKAALAPIDAEKLAKLTPLLQQLQACVPPLPMTSVSPPFAFDSVDELFDSVLKKVTADASRRAALLHSFYSFLQNDSSIITCCKQMAGLILLPPDLVKVVGHLSQALVKSVREESDFSTFKAHHRFEYAIALATKKAIIDLIETCPDLQYLTQTVAKLAPDFVKE